MTEIQAFAASKGIELMPVHTASLKKFATGSGRASKTEIIEAAKARGWTPVDDNEADASLLLEYGLFELNGPVIFTPKKGFNNGKHSEV